MKTCNHRRYAPTCAWCASAPVDQVRQRLQQLHDVGIGAYRLSRTLHERGFDVDRDILGSLRLGYRTRVNRPLAEAILAVPVPERRVWRNSLASNVSPVKSIRQLQGLSADGFPFRDIARLADVDLSGVQTTANVQAVCVQRWWAERIDVVADKLADQDPPDTVAARGAQTKALRNGWRPLGAWVGRDISDPYTLPIDESQYVDEVTVARAVHEVLCGFQLPSGLNEATTIEVMGRLFHQYGVSLQALGRAMPDVLTEAPAKRLIRRYDQLRAPAREVPMIVLVTGSRHADRPRHLMEIWYEMVKAVNGRPGPHILIEGGAEGADEAARIVAELLGWRAISMPADWQGPCRKTCRQGTATHRRTRPNGTDYCPAAGNYRNQEMVDRVLELLAVGPEYEAVCLGFPTPGSIGTRDCLGRAKAAGIPQVVVPLEASPVDQSVAKDPYAPVRRHLHASRR